MSSQKTNASLLDEGEMALQTKPLNRPRFFRGQLLKEDDLSAIVSWTQQRFTLHHGLHGMGIVRGIYVKKQTTESPSIAVCPGYAIDKFGRDVVVHNAKVVPLEEIAPETRECAKHDGKYYVDVGIKYAETKADAQPILAPRDKLEPPCDYARLREEYTICPIPPTELNERYKAWEQDYLAAMEKVDKNAAIQELLDDRNSLLASYQLHEFGPTCIPIARLWLKRENERYQVEIVDNSIPYRLVLTINGLPAPSPQQINLAAYVGQSPAKVTRSLLEDEQITVGEQTDVTDANPQKWFEPERLFAKPGDELNIVYVKRNKLSEVIAFENTTTDG